MCLPSVHPHESPPLMSIPLVLLAIPAAIIGFVGVPPDDGLIDHFLGPVFRTAEELGQSVTPGFTQPTMLIMLISTMVAMAASVTGFHALFQAERLPAVLASNVPWLYNALLNAGTSTSFTTKCS